MVEATEDVSRKKNKTHKKIPSRKMKVKNLQNIQIAIILSVVMLNVLLQIQKKI